MELIYGESMDRNVTAQLLENIPHNKLGVLGDFCTDVYWELNPEPGERSIETGLVTTSVSTARYSPGGAGNIIANLRGVGMKKIPCFGAVGTDPFGLWLHHELTGNAPEYAQTLLKIGRKDYHTPVYCKPLLNDVEQPRIDLGNTPLTDAEARELLSQTAALLPELKVLIVNEQIRNGIHTPVFRTGFAQLIKEFSGKVKFVFDGRDYLDAYPGVTLKINAHAASKLAFGKEDRHPLESGKAILERDGEELVITDGDNGCYVFEHHRVTHIPAIRYSGMVDTVGAGDSFTAGFAYALASGATMVTAAEFGTCCSAVTIRKLNQTGAPSPQEIMELL